MKPGNISNAILKRSVYGLLGKNQKGGKERPSVGREAAAYSLFLPTQGQAAKEGAASGSVGQAVSAVGTGLYGVYRASNVLWAEGGEPVSAALQLFLPENFEEGELKALVRRLEAQCEALELLVTAAGVQVCQGIAQPLVSVVCTGRMMEEMSPAYAQAGEFVIATKWVGMEGMRILGETYRDKICSYFTESYFEQAMGEEKNLSVRTEACIARQAGVKSVYAAGEGGIFGALWNLAEASGVGLDLDFRKIPVKQELVEVCELLGKNLYEMSCFGCLLMTSKRGYDIVKLLHQQGIPACIIGKTTDSQDKIIHNEEEIRFLDAPKQDEIYK